MADDLWFRKKTYGWGWTPANAKGWLVILLFVIAILVYPTLAMLHWFEFSVPVFLISTFGCSALLFFICYKKGEKPSWNWGE